MKVFETKSVIPVDEGVERGRGMRGAGGRRPLALRCLDDASKNLKLPQPKSSVVLAHSEAVEGLPAVHPLCPAPREPEEREEVRTPPWGLESLVEKSS